MFGIALAPENYQKIVKDVLRDCKGAANIADREGQFVEISGAMPIMDYVKVCLEEIALEGLDGITLQALWLRLENVKPAFPLPLDDATKSFLWTSVISHERALQFYELPEPRPHLAIFNRFDFADPETGICVEQENQPENIYPLLMVHDSKCDIMGSCATYQTRKNITETVGSGQGAVPCSMKDVEERWGDKFVIVASQQLRNRALYGREADVTMLLPLKQYCFIERIGRSRYHGEVTNGLNSLAIFKGAIKSVFYMKKLLMRRDLITAQPFNQRVIRGQNVGSSLFHLKRFFVLRKTMYFTWLETLTHTLAQCDKQRESLAKLRIDMGIAEKTFKKLLALGSKYISRETIVYREYKTDATKEEYMCKNKTAERSLRVLTLKKLYTFKLGEHIEEEEGEDGGSDGGEEDDSTSRSTSQAMEGVSQRYYRVYERPMLHQVYAYVMAQAEKGITQKSLGEAFGIGKLESRMLCRNLERHEVVHKFLHDRGRQRVQKYIAHQYVTVSCLGGKEKGVGETGGKITGVKERGVGETRAKEREVGETGGKGSGQNVMEGIERKSYSAAVIEGVHSPPVHYCQLSYVRYIAHQYTAGSRLHQALEAEKTKIRAHSRKQKGGAICSEDGDELLEAIGGRVTTPAVSKASNEKPVTSEKVDVKEKHHTDSAESLHQVFYDPKDYSMQFQNVKKKSAHVTYRMLRRANIILEAVKEARLIDNIFTIQKKIIDQEFEEGHEYRLDKKSLIRLIDRLVKEGQIKSIKTMIECGSGLKELYFVCVPEMASDDPLIQSAIEANKQKTIGLNKEATSELRRKETGPDGKTHARFSTLSALKSDVKVADMEYDPGAGKCYGYVPRMKRIMIVHQYIWYMVYTYGQREEVLADEVALTSAGRGTEVHPNGDMMSSVTQAVETASGIHVASPDDNKLSPAREHPLPKVYVDDNSWRRFLPPLPKHYGYGDGWCLIGDLLLVIPIGIFCQIIRVNFKIKDLSEYLKDPVLRNLCVNQLPVLMRQQLMHERKYIFHFYEVCTYLCQMGLLTFGKRAWREKEQIFVYLHRRASIIDTSAETTGLAERPVSSYEFNVFKDIEKYWFNLQWICCNTSYEVIKCPTNKMAVSKTSKPPERFLQCLKGKAVEEIVDDGKIPGDQEGASGLDSSFWAHLRRNWTFKGVDVKMEAMTKDGHKKMVDGSHRRKKGNVKTHQGEPQSQQGTRRLLKCRIVKRGDVIVLGKKTIQTVPVKTGELRKGGKGFKRKAAGDADKAAVPKKRRRPAKTVPGGSSSSKSYDDVDQQALHRMTKERVDWSTQEDSMLLLCKVALLFLSSERRHGMLVNWCVIRDILHKHCRSARDKTSKACQRRVMYVMKNPQTKLNVDVYVGEALQDTALVQEFRKGKKYVKTDLEKNTAMFQSLLAKLLKKFKASLTGSAVELPDKLEEVYKKYNVVKGPKTTVTVHKDVTNEHDIYASVLHNVIHSAMLLNDKTGRDHELYQLFSQYPENLLLEVFNCMKNDGIITRIKKHEHRKFRWNAIPCVSLGNYHVAQRYMYRWFSRYPRNVFIAASDILEQMPEQPTGGSISAPTNDGEWMENRKTGGCTAVIVSLMARGQVRFNLVIPERIIAIDSARKKGQVGSKVTELTLSDEEEEAMLEEVEKMKMSGVTQGDSGTDDDKQTRGDIESGDSTDHTPAAKTGTDVGSDNHDSVVGGASSSIIFDKRVNVGASRVMLAMLREQPVGGASKVLHPTDNIVIKMCDVKLQLKANQPRAPPGGPLPGPEHAVHEFLERWNQSHLYLHLKTQFHMLRSLRIQQPASVDYSHVITSCHDEFTSHSLHVEDMTRIYEEVKGQGVLGITCYQLQQLFCGVRMLDLYLKILLNHRMDTSVTRTPQSPEHLSHQDTQSQRHLGHRDTSVTGLPQSPGCLSHCDASVTVMFQVTGTPQSLGHLSHRDTSVTGTPQSPGHLSNRDGSITWTPQSLGHLSHEYASVTRTPQSPECLSHEDTTVTETPQSPRRLGHRDASVARTPQSAEHLRHRTPQSIYNWPSC
ncbi:General transcription factor 3C polypeptide 1 [Lamellibrachia satsuma]|nr:General transcription factor 3C polypeptide 1 [Lamellibrachia satsuma]